MAKFAELTRAIDGARILINPEHVITFERALQSDHPKAMTRLLMPNGLQRCVIEPPEEVLARLCSPVEPDGSASAELAEWIHDIGVLRRWSEDNEATSTGPDNELGKAWELLDDIEDRLKRLL